MNRERQGELITVLTNLYLHYNEDCLKVYFREIIDKGKMTNLEVHKIMKNPQALIDMPEYIWVWLYCPLFEIKNNDKNMFQGIILKSPSFYFEKLEIQEADSIIGEKLQMNFPIEFPIYCTLFNGNSFLTSVSIRQIFELKKKNIIQWKQNMQREVKNVKIGDTLLSHIAYDDKRAREIGKLMADNNYFPDTLRWHIVENDCEYSVYEDRLVLKSGYIAELDGMHRNRGSEYALEEDPQLDLSLPIIITIGNQAMGQMIIKQNETRAPLNKHLLATYENNSANRILKKVVASDELDAVYRFVDTISGIKTEAGFILKSVMSEAINKFYIKDQKNLPKKQEDEIANWLIEFLNELASHCYESFKNYKNEKKNSWVANYKAFFGYVKYSSIIWKSDNWEEILAKKIHSISDEFKDLSWINTDKAIKRIGLIFER